MQFVYWVPTEKGGTVVGRDAINRHGLQDVLPGRVTVRPTTSGPTGQCGAVLANLSDSPLDVGFYPGRQQWVRIDESEAWVGFETKSPPTPSDLQRDKLTPVGKWLELADGNQWFAPIAQRPIENEHGTRPLCVLPEKVAKVNGEWIVGGVANRYRQLWELACETWDRLVINADKQTNISIQFDWATKSLSANYRIGPTEAGLLGIWESDGLATWEVLRTLIDLDGWEAIMSGESQAAT